MAVDPTLGKNEKIGFPDSYRQGFDDRIFRDIRRKLPLLGREKKVVLDIGPGCAGLADRLIELCGKKNILSSSLTLRKCYLCYPTEDT